MTTPTRAERRLLSDDEYELVAQTHHPALTMIETPELSRLTSLIRERRDRAKDIANKQRREVRGKGRANTNFAAKDLGNRRKAGVLGEALSRLNKERSRRNARARLSENAHKALELKRDSASQKRPAPGRTAGKGMASSENPKAERIGSEMHAGRISQAGKTAQAKRDSK
ncbi:hypothetical protein [Microvirga flavescens]|uniref:hypothetical protein n=1 Tax=Microvirga flavescens TaxID=2249811 RepID=UPI000DDAF325|nr:hypothetical protein [Microvirga flavescens]